MTFGLVLSKRGTDYCGRLRNVTICYPINTFRGVETKDTDVPFLSHGIQY
jgi:hypothetical protein